MTGGVRSPARSRRRPDLAAFATSQDEAQFADFSGVLTCENGHTFPANAGACPYDPQPPPSRRRAAPLRGARGAESVPPVVQAFIDQSVVNVDNGQAPRSPHAYGWENAKLGVVNHIPVCDTLAQLTAYFNGGSAQGSTHFGVGREHAGDLAWEGRRIPCAPVHQYMPIVGSVAPWAQGAIQTSASCSIRPSPTIRGMRSGEPNGAFVSIENVARQGSDGLTDAQFNANVFLRAYCAAYFGHEITPGTQLWHAEVDQLNRCFDPGWDGALEEAMQEAARQVLRGDIAGLRGVSSEDPAPNGGGGGGVIPTLEQVQLGLISKVLAQDWRALRDDAAKLAGDA